MFRRVVQLSVGLVCFGFAAAMMIEAQVGVDPWTVFAQGLANVTGLSLGTLTVLTGVAVMLLWIPLRQKPGIGTVLNILVVGPMIDLGMLVLETPPELWQRVLLFGLGLALLAVASGLYIGSHFGAGPRDGLMTGLHSRFGVPIWLGRTSVEATVLVIGWVLGGDVGLGTVAFALLIGPLCGLTLPWLEVPRRPAQPNVEEVSQTSV